MSYLEKYVMKISLLVIIVVSIVPIIPYVFADCTVNTDWSDAPCLDLIINGKYQQHELDKWTDYYSYKGSTFMEEKHLELNQAIKDNNLQEWVDESMSHRNVYEYYFFSGRAPNTGEYNGQFDVIKVNEDNAPQYAELPLPNMMPSILYDFGLIYITILIIIVIIASLAVGIIFVYRRKQRIRK